MSTSPSIETAKKVSDPKSTIALAETFFSQKRYMEAIELLMEENRRCRNADIERQLIRFRSAAYVKMERPKTNPDWPGQVEDLFPDVEGIPEIEAEQLTAEILRSAIFTHGSLIVRSLVSELRADHLRENMDRVFSELEGRMPLAGRSVWWGLWQKHVKRPVLVTNTDSIYTVDSPAMTFDVIETFEEVGLGKLVHEFFDEKPALLSRKWTLRRISSEMKMPKSGFHQDGVFLGKEIRSLNLWLSLSECGDVAPGLDIVGRRLDDIVETGTDDAGLFWTVGSKEVERVSKGLVVRPVFKPGDAVFFDHMSLHSTAVAPEMNQDRYAIESWFIAPSCYQEAAGKLNAEKRFPLVY